MYDVITMGRTGVDIYPLDHGVPLEEVRTFEKFLGGSATNVAVAAARLGVGVRAVLAVGLQPGDLERDVGAGARFACGDGGGRPDRDERAVVGGRRRGRGRERALRRDVALRLHDGDGAGRRAPARDEGGDAQGGGDCGE